ncbi:chromosome (plasmid) partitioning protein para / sporulation initiation inhibitor protein soj [hydrocarbon metagenome]|uniref:Chromosome (Plasmid) partitioning protein para / sporulation initiation inhibitor protein soj n=1 Tax=hydrocarbon metagenome TaxID=938273 RepID=A0A0W8E2N5_9ZZZZ
MARVISVANQKGGVGKTTTAINLAACIALKGYKTLIVDSDPQGNASSGLGVNRDRLKYCIYDLLINEVPVKEVICSTRVRNLDIIPATIQLAGAEVELAGRDSRENYLKEAIQPVKEAYDWIFIDCPPSLGILTLNALNASKSVIIPLQCEYYALEGLSQLINTITLVKKRMNKDLNIEGIVFTMFDARTNLSIQVVDQVKTHFKRQVYRTIIPRNVRLSEAPSHGKPIVVYDPRSKGAEVYQDLAVEVLRRA